MAKRIDIEEQLRRTIVESSMTCYAISKSSGVAESVLSNFVNSHRSITMETAAKLANVLGLELKARRREGR